VEKTYVTKKEDVQREWFVVDAEGQTLGRLASEVAKVLCGKHKPKYSPAVDVGDYVIVVNSGKIRVTGRKLDQKNCAICCGSIPPGRLSTPCEVCFPRIDWDGGC